MNSSIPPDNSKPTLKERLFPDVKTEEGLEKARTLGVFAAGYLGVAFVVTAFTTGTIFDPLPSMPADQQLTTIVSAIGAIGWFFAAYRIAKRKGRIAIWLVLIYAIFSLLTKLASGAGGPGPFLSLLAVWGAVNGVRAIRITSSNKQKQAYDQLSSDEDDNDMKREQDVGISHDTKPLTQRNEVGKSGTGRKWKITPTQWLGVLGNTVALGISLLLLGASRYPRLFDYNYYDEIQWGRAISLLVMPACFAMNLYVIWLGIRDNEMLNLAREVKKAKMEKELQEIKSSI